MEDGSGGGGTSCTEGPLDESELSVWVADSAREGGLLDSTVIGVGTAGACDGEDETSLCNPTSLLPATGGGNRIGTGSTHPSKS